MSKPDNIGKIVTVLVAFLMLTTFTLQFIPLTLEAQSSDGNIIEDPEVYWALQTGTTIKGQPVDDDSFVYLVTSIKSDATAESEGTILAISKKTGEVKYQYDIGEKGEYFERDVTSITVYKDRLFVCSNNNGLTCLNKTSFLEIWSQPYNNINPLTIYQEKIFFTHSGRNLYCLDIETGNDLWSYPVGVTNCVPAVYEDHVFGADYDKIFILKINNGEVVWSNGILRTNQVEALSSPIISDTNMIITTSDYNLHVFTILGSGTSQIKLGNELWTLEGRRLYPHFCQPVVHNDKLFVCYDNSLNAHDLTGGSSLWTRELACERVALAGDALVVTSETTVYAIDPESGDTIWELDFASEDIEGDPDIGRITSGYILVDNDSIYVTDDEGWIYRISDSKADDENDAEVHWPLSICINAFIVIIIIVAIYLIMKWRMKRK
jgi:outer membrane protein assembly factor BamB